MNAQEAFILIVFTLRDPDLDMSKRLTAFIHLHLVNELCFNACDIRISSNEMDDAYVQMANC